LDAVIESFLALVGGRLQLSPAVKAVDWLVRRFRYEPCTMSLTMQLTTTPGFMNITRLAFY
jgi:U3 small nucleolar RNA-associated protein 10